MNTLLLRLLTNYLKGKAMKAIAMFFVRNFVLDLVYDAVIDALVKLSEKYDGEDKYKFDDNAIAALREMKEDAVKRMKELV